MCWSVRIRLNICILYTFKKSFPYLQIFSLPIRRKEGWRLFSTSTANFDSKLISHILVLHLSSLCLTQNFIFFLEVSTANFDSKLISHFLFFLSFGTNFVFFLQCKKKPTWSIMFIETRLVSWPLIVTEYFVSTLKSDLSYICAPFHVWRS